MGYQSKQIVLFLGLTDSLPSSMVMEVSTIKKAENTRTELKIRQTVIRFIIDI